MRQKISDEGDLELGDEGDLELDDEGDLELDDEGDLDLDDEGVFKLDDERSLGLEIEELKGASGDRDKELYGIDSGGGTGSINNDTVLMLDEETNLVLCSSISDEGYLELDE